MKYTMLGPIQRRMSVTVECEHDRNGGVEVLVYAFLCRIDGFYVLTANGLNIRWLLVLQ